MKRPLVIAGNWKMNLGPREAKQFFVELRTRWPESNLEKGKDGLETVLFVPDLSLASSQQTAAGLPIEIGAQNAHWEEQGAFTGETSGKMLRECGVTHVLVGHSERRQFFGETDETVRKRTESLLDQGFQVMVCIGESQQERESGQTQQVLQKQLEGVFCPNGRATSALTVDLPAGKRSVSVAYEPVWAIGTGLTATPAQAEEAHHFIRTWISKTLSPQAAEGTPLLYGGSVKPDNIDELLSCENIDGALVGGASLKPESFLSLIASGVKAL